MTSRLDRMRLEDVVIAINLIRQYADRHTDSDVPSSDPLIGDAILYRFVILGEAVMGLSKETLAQMPGINWPDIVGMRNVVAHEYFQVDWSIVEATIERDLPAVEAAIKAQLGVADQ